MHCPLGQSLGCEGRRVLHHFTDNLASIFPLKRLFPHLFLCSVRTQIDMKCCVAKHSLAYSFSS